MLNLENVRKTYPGFAMDVTLRVLPGRITGLIGANGAGKTTCFKAVLGLIKPDSGKITIGGTDAQLLTEADRTKIGAVLAESGFSGYLTVGDTVPILRALYPQFDEQKFRGQLAASGLELKKKIKDLSTGMRAKLKILIALSYSAKLLILDEPTAGLDVIARDEILQLLRQFIEEDESRSIFISSHISSDLEMLCDDFYMIEKGQILLHEETDRLQSTYGILKVSGEAMQTLDKRYLRKVLREPYGWRCLTDERQFYLENYPQLVLERSGIDELLLLYIRGEAL